jgi:homoserine dehydrogenase
VLAFEAAVAGGIPIIKALRDGLAANTFTRVAGILNGTCNYILTQMLKGNLSFDAALEQAQKLGYAEADPTFDVDGIDTAHKLAILASLAFGTAPSISTVATSGIGHITGKDMHLAEKLGYRIKLLGIAELAGDNVNQRVQPCLVPASSPLANVHDVYNAIAVVGSSVGKVFFEGRGAGAGPTASSVVADIMDIARGAVYKPFTLPVASLKQAGTATEGGEAPYYLRLSVLDKPGVLADITHAFKAEGISVRTFLQEAHNPGAAVDVVLTTHEASEAAMHKAIAAISTFKTNLEPPMLLRIEDV